MELANHILLVGAALLFVSVLSALASARLGLPLLLMFLVVGMLAGEDGPGGIQFSDFGTAFLVGNLSLAVILLDGGLRTRLDTFRVALAPAMLLATVGVLLTAVLLGAAAVWLLGVDWRLGLLIGAIVGSTDAAAVFSILRSGGVALNRRVSATLEIESGVNDPMAVFLTVALIGIVQAGQDAVPLDLVRLLLWQFGIGAAGGVVLGGVLAALMARVRLTRGLYGLLFASGGVAAFALINELGGSGFLGVYLVGLVVGNRRLPNAEHVLRVTDSLAWLAQAGMFLVLGLLVTPRDVLGHFVEASALALALMVFARPLAVLACLAPLRVPAREVALIAWVGLRGAVPIVLALFPVLGNVPQSDRIFEVTFFVVVLSLLVQGSTVAPLARRLGLTIPADPEPGLRVELRETRTGRYELVRLDLERGSPMAGRPSERLLQGLGGRLVGLFRGDRLLTEPPPTLEVGDQIFVLAESASVPLLVRRTQAERGPAEASPRRVYGDFALQGDARIDAVADVYGLVLGEAERGLSVGELVSRRLRRPPVPGDRVELGPVTLVVREVNGEVRTVGLRLQPPAKGNE